MLLQAFTRLLDGHCTPAFVRACAADPGRAQPLADEIEQAGFHALLLPEADGGAGLPLAGLVPFLIAAGERLAPVPFGETALRRAGHAQLPLPARAALRAAGMAGMSAHVLAMTIDHVTTRQQFGRPLAAFQAIQQQLALMAEDVAAATLAAHIGFGGPGFTPERSAAAKLRANEAAVRIIAVAHQLHGAIGATNEFDLQLWTGALSAARLADGGESHWAAVLARHRLSAAPADSAAYIRTHLQPGDAA